MVSSKKLKKEKLAAKIINTLFKANILMILKPVNWFLYDGNINFFLRGSFALNG